MYIFILTLMYALWSSMFSFAKIALEFSPPLFLTALRMLLAGVLLLAFLGWRRPKDLRLSLRALGLLGLLALFAMYLTNALEFWSLQHLTAAKTCFIYSLTPFFSAFFSYLHFSEKMNLRKWLGMAIGFTGFLPVLAMQKGSGELLTGFHLFSWPELAMVGASLCTAYGWVLLRMAVQKGIPLLVANGISMGIGGVFALIHSYYIEPWNPWPVDAAHWLPLTQSLVVMTLISNVICYNLYGLMLKRFTATFISFTGLLSPIFASLNAWIFLRESPSPIIFLSTGIVSLGLWLIYSAELRQGYILQRSPQTT